MLPIAGDELDMVGSAKLPPASPWSSCFTAAFAPGARLAAAHLLGSEGTEAPLRQRSAPTGSYRRGAGVGG